MIACAPAPNPVFDGSWNANPATLSARTMLQHLNVVAHLWSSLTFHRHTFGSQGHTFWFEAHVTHLDITLTSHHHTFSSHFSHPRGDEEDALCAVCGDGSSVEPNQILFCERCDLAVHQQCYGLADIPEGEWLCWPCAQHEQEQRLKGVEQSAIRPPRWVMFMFM